MIFLIILLCKFLELICRRWKNNIRFKYHILQFNLCIVILLILVVGACYLNDEKDINLGNALISLAISAAVSFLFMDNRLTKEKEEQFAIMIKCYYGLKYLKLHINEQEFKYVKEKLHKFLYEYYISVDEANINEIKPILRTIEEKFIIEDNVELIDNDLIDSLVKKLEKFMLKKYKKKFIAISSKTIIDFTIM
mgnify:FL=1